MITLDDLKSIILLSRLTDSMLDKIAEITLTTEYSGGDHIFRQGDYAQHFYSILKGNVGLELEKATGGPIMVETIGQGQSFGFSVLVDTELKKYTTHAKALTDTRLFMWEGTELETLFYQDYEMGFLFMKRIAKIAKSRLQTRNVQYMNIYSRPSPADTPTPG
jgi:CRP-like cAMP-binding protein